MPRASLSARYTLPAIIVSFTLSPGSIFSILYPSKASPPGFRPCLSPPTAPRYDHAGVLPLFKIGFNIVGMISLQDISNHVPPETIVTRETHKNKEAFSSRSSVNLGLTQGECRAEQNSAALLKGRGSRQGGIPYAGSFACLRLCSYSNYLVPCIIRNSQ